MANQQKTLETLNRLWYIEHKEGHLLLTGAPLGAPLQRWSIPSEAVTSQWEAPILVSTGWALFFSLVYFYSFRIIFTFQCALPAVLDIVTRGCRSFLVSAISSAPLINGNISFLLKRRELYKFNLVSVGNANIHFCCISPLLQVMFYNIFGSIRHLQFA